MKPCLNKRIGKIQHVSFGLGGYQNAQLGISFTLGSDKDGWGVGDFKGNWDAETIEHSKNCEWTEEERDKSYAETMRYLSKLLRQAKVKDVSELKGIPVEVTFEGNVLKEWRILEEVL